MLLRVVFINLAILLLTSSAAQSVMSDRVGSFLKLTNSPRSVGIGEVTVNLVDVQSALNNPGAFGIFSLDNNFLISIPSKTKWQPKYFDDMYLKTWSIGGGYSPNLSKDIGKDKKKISISAAYSEKTFERSSAELTSPLNDKSQNITFGLGIDYYIRVGLGFTNKNLSIYNGTHESKSNAHDIGLLVELPLSRFIEILPTSINNLKLELTPSIAIVKANNGDSVTYIDYDLVAYIPKLKKIGYGINADFTKNSKSIMKFLFVYEKETDLVNDIEMDAFTRKGLEIGLMNTLFVRTGNVQEENYSENDYSSIGFGLSLRGLLNTISQRSMNNESTGAIKYIFHHLDLKFDWAKISEENHYLDDTKFMKLSISI